MNSQHLKIELRHYQHKTAAGVPYRWTGETPNTLQKFEGVPNGVVETTNYFDVSNLVINSEDIDFTWSVGDNDNHIKAALTEEIEFTGSAARFIRDWLVNRAYSPMNIVEVRFTDLLCGKVIGEYLIKPQKISYCIYDDCNVSVTAVENDAFFDCLNKTKISDNKNGFMNQGFRAYDYAVEKRPVVMTGVLICLAAPVFIIGLALIPITAVIDVVLNVFNVNFDPITLNDLRQTFWDMVGVGRVHAAAGARDYTDNVCEICGVTVDEDNNFLYKQQIQHDGQTIQNPFFWLDIFFASTKRGKGNNDPERFKLQDVNIPIIALTDLLNDLTKVFNAKWYVTQNGLLRFLLKQEFANNTPILDFSDANTAEANRILKLCHDVTDKTQPLTAEFGYQQDTIDLAGNDVLLRYNSKASYDADGNPNPNLKGDIDYRVPFGATSFRDDNVRKDYLDEATNSLFVFVGAFAVILLGAVFFIIGTGLGSTLIALAQGALLILIGGALFAAAVSYIGASTLLDNSFTDVLVMSQDTCSLPKLLIRQQQQDGQIDDARAVNGGAGSTKIPNILFNPLSKTYDQIHDYNEETPVQNLRNYPAFFDVKFKNNVYDICWSKTDHRQNAVTERKTSVEFIACCEALELLGVYQDTNIAIDEKFKFPQELAGESTFVTNAARIEQIKVNFVSRQVELTGTNFN